MTEVKLGQIGKLRKDLSHEPRYLVAAFGVAVAVGILYLLLSRL